MFLRLGLGAGLIAATVVIALAPLLATAQDKLVVTASDPDRRIVREFNAGYDWFESHTTADVLSGRSAYYLEMIARAAYVAITAAESRTDAAYKDLLPRLDFQAILQDFWLCHLLSPKRRSSRLRFIYLTLLNRISCKGDL